MAEELLRDEEELQRKMLRQAKRRSDKKKRQRAARRNTSTEQETIVPQNTIDQPPLRPSSPPNPVTFPLSSYAKDENDEDKLCVICMTEARSHVLVPCGHFCICAGCAKVDDAPFAVPIAPFL